MALLLLTGGIAAEAARRLLATAPASAAAVPGVTVTVVAAIGIAVNLSTALLFVSGRGAAINVRAAFAHALSAAVVAARGIAAWSRPAC